MFKFQKYLNFKKNKIILKIASKKISLKNVKRKIEQKKKGKKKQRKKEWECRPNNPPGGVRRLVRANQVGEQHPPPLSAIPI
jgi:hypothetical protein